MIEYVSEMSCEYAEQKVLNIERPTLYGVLNDFISICYQDIAFSLFFNISLISYKLKIIFISLFVNYNKEREVVPVIIDYRIMQCQISIIIRNVQSTRN